MDDNSTVTLPGFDVFQVGLVGISPSPILNGTALNGISIDLMDGSETALSDESLPLDFDLTDWPSSGRLLVIRPLGSNDVTLGRIDTLVSAVPVPAALWPFGSGLAMLGWTSRRSGAS